MLWRGRRVIRTSLPVLSVYLSGTTMPLPNVVSGRTPQCTARSKRSLRRCLNPAAFGCKTCRFHGARKPESVKRGSAHPQYKHGRETVEARRRRVEAMGRIRDLVELGVRGGFIERRIPFPLSPSERSPQK